MSQLVSVYIGFLKKEVLTPDGEIPQERQMTLPVRLRAIRQKALVSLFFVLLCELPSEWKVRSKFRVALLPQMIQTKKEKKILSKMCPAAWVLVDPRYGQASQIENELGQRESKNSRVLFSELEILRTIN